MPVLLDLHIPRHAFSLRERARAGDIWRACQEAAVLGSSAVGWPPLRYRAEGCAFVVRSMTCVHHTEAVYGEPVRARTWVRDFRRGLLTTREIRLSGQGGRPLADATQEWVHVLFQKDGQGGALLRPARASATLLEAFPQEHLDPAPEWGPTDRPVQGVEVTWQADLWHVRMDPLGHLNHPDYVDLADEATSRRMVSAGLDPSHLVPVAESIEFRAGLSAGPCQVVSRVTGVLGASVEQEHRIVRPDGALAAVAKTRRTLAERPERLLHLLREMDHES